MPRHRPAPTLRRLIGVPLFGAVALAAWLGGAAPAPAATVLGIQGERYELLPSRLAGQPALVLKVLRSGEPELAIAVPETENAGVEDWESLILEDQSGIVYALWRSRSDGGQSVLKIAGWRNGAWTEPMAVSSESSATKLSPQVLVTHERTPLGVDQWVERTVLHVLWAEEASGVVDIFYAPVILAGGAGPAPPTVFHLNERAQLKSWSPLVDLSPALQRAPRLLPGRDARTVVAAFADSASGRVVAMEIDLLAQELSRAAERAQARLLAGGLSALGADGSVERALMASTARAAVLDNQELVREAVQPLATALGDLILQANVSNAGELTALAFKARAHLIIGGARLRDRGVQSATAAESQGFSTARGADGSALDLRFAVTRSLPAPALGEGAVRLLSARDGSRLLVSWSTAAKVSYRISEGSDWSDVREIALSAELPLANALALLEGLVQAR